MNLARRTLQPVTDTRADDSSSSYGTSSSTAHGNQMVVSSKNKSKSKSSTSGTRALSRKTRSAVEAWMQKLFLSDRQSKRSELTRRASTGSMTGCSSSGGAFDVENSLEPRAKRRSSFFSSSRGKENSNASNTKKKKESAQPLWLQPVASLPAIECEPQSSASHKQKAPVSALSLALHVHEPELQVYVVPPVEMPTNYRAQDRRGGMIVSGRAVLFTNAAFKRKLRNLSQLRVIPEHRPAQMLASHLDVYRSYMEASEPLSSPCSSLSPYGDDDDEIVPLSQWI